MLGFAKRLKSCRRATATSWRCTITSTSACTRLRRASQRPRVRCAPAFIAHAHACAQSSSEARWPRRLQLLESPSGARCAPESLRQTFLANASQGVAEKERAHSLDEFARLARLPHGLHEVRQRMELATDEADHELAIRGVEPVTGQTDIVGELLRPVGHPDLRVLAEYLALVVGLQAGEGPRPAKGVPDVPAVRLVEHVL